MLKKNTIDGYINKGVPRNHLCDAHQWTTIHVLYCIHTKKLNCLKSGVEFDMNDNLYEFKYLHHF